MADTEGPFTGGQANWALRGHSYPVTYGDRVTLISRGSPDVG